MNINSLSNNFPGYGMFWVTNSITSALLGFNNRRLQEKAHEQNIEFQREMERAREITENQKNQEEIAFKRRLVAVSREYRQQESKTSFQMQLQGIELQNFLNSCWPLDMQLPSILFSDMENNANKMLNVVLMHCPLLPLGKYGGTDERDSDIYRQIEWEIQNYDIPCIEGVKFRKDACVKPEMTGGNACLMNIHFLMSQIPSLVILPHYREGRLYFKGAVWEPQSTRPMIRNLFSVDYEPEIAKSDDNYLKEMTDLIHASISVIIGTVRDSFMLLVHGVKPTLNKWINDDGHEKMKGIVNGNKEIIAYIKRSVDDMLSALNKENIPDIYKFYSVKDIESMQKMILSAYKI